MVEGDAGNINERYQFIKNIYNDSWALIIGINKYKNVDHLNFAVEDAIDVKEMLSDKYGFKESNIKLITDADATKENILAGFNEILKKAGERDRVIIFFAGHGDTYKLPTGGYKGYLIPVDGDLEDLFLSGIAMNTIYEIADMSFAKHILYLVDACYGGLAITRGLDREITPQYLEKMTMERGRQVITAGGKDEEVIEKPEWGHSAFTRNLLRGLDDELADENNDGFITGDELGGFIKSRVAIDVGGAHTPQEGRIGSDMGEFVFISETAEEQFAEAYAIEMDDLSTLQSEVVELKEKLRSQGGGSSNITSFNVETASTLSWVFPGLGHYYSGKINKGFFYTGLELAALTSVVITSSSYFDKADKYKTAETDYNNFSPSTYNGDIPAGEERENLRSILLSTYDTQLSAMYAFIGTATVSAGIWLWNVMDLKKTNSYSDNISISINSRGQVEARISF